MVGRFIASLVVVFCWGFAEWAFSIPATLMTGQIASKQFENSDEGYIVSQAAFRVFQSANWLITAVFLLVLLAIWWHPLKKAVEFLKNGPAALLAALAVTSLLTYAQPARAYYDQTDYTEVYFILPNESAFFVPDVGANKDSQAKFGSEDYYKENKIPAKRYQIPHAKLPNSGAWSNFYVPTGRLIIVDRTPYSREWTASTNRGSSSRNESFPCQSSEGLDITVGIAIGASVTEENAPKFLYNFGVKPPVGDRSKPEVIFTSVYFGRSLIDVMDGPIRNKVQALACSEFTTRTLDKGNSEAATIMANIETKTKEYLDKRGINLDYIGWADTFSFEKPVQEAINRKYIADKDAAVALALAPHVDTLQGVAEAEAIRKWNGVMPTTMSLWWFPSNLKEWFSGLFNNKK